VCRSRRCSSAHPAVRLRGRGERVVHLQPVKLGPTDGERVADPSSAERGGQCSWTAPTSGATGPSQSRRIAGPRGRRTALSAPRPTRRAGWAGSASPEPVADLIERPVATSLLMVAVMLVGHRGVPSLPLAALPEVGLPTIQSNPLPGREPRGHDLRGDRPARAPFRPHAKPQADFVHQLPREASVTHPAVLRST